LAVDLGAGFGMHSIPLARAGFRVVSIDTSELLLSELSALAGDLSIDIRCGDLLDFATFLPADLRPRLILCMGDTLTHLDDFNSVRRLAQIVAENLERGGRFLATFRDYTQLPRGDARFIPVRSSDDRIFTCFLEEHPEHVQVHDIVHERREGGWTTRVSSYRKLRLDPERARQAFVSLGLKAKVEPGPRGMQRLIVDA
ncbi:MAG: methyltransferase domain-containing protein, partial [Verrucomicrobiia bacterium]